MKIRRVVIFGKSLVLEAVYYILAGYSSKIEIVGRFSTDIASLPADIQSTRQLEPDVIVCDEYEANLRIIQEAFGCSPSIRLVQVNIIKNKANVANEKNLPLNSSLDLFQLIVN